MDIKLTILMVSYNEREFLSHSIDSILNQSFKDWELIIGDDGSSDGSLEVIESYQKKYPEQISYYVMSRDDGEKIPSIRVSNNLKHGFELAQGEYIAIISGDDYYCNNKFARDIEFLSKNKKYSACVSDFSYVYEDQTRNVIVHNQNSRSLFWSARYAHISCFTFKRECLKNLLLNFCDDTGLIFSIACTGKWKYFHSADFAYRQRNSGITKTSNDIQLNMIELLLYDEIRLTKRFRLSSCSRFKKPLHNVFKQRKSILENKEKYELYFMQEAKYAGKQCLLSDIVNYNNLKVHQKIKIRFLLFKSSCLRLLFTVFIKLQNLFLVRGKSGN